MKEVMKKAINIVYKNSNLEGVNETGEFLLDTNNYIYLSDFDEAHGYCENHKPCMESLYKILVESDNMPEYTESNLELVKLEGGDVKILGGDFAVNETGSNYSNGEIHIDDFIKLLNQTNPDKKNVTYLSYRIVNVYDLESDNINAECEG